jgi:hypothetical protein
VAETREKRFKRAELALKREARRERGGRAAAARLPGRGWEGREEKNSGKKTQRAARLASERVRGAAPATSFRGRHRNSGRGRADAWQEKSERRLGDCVRRRKTAARGSKKKKKREREKKRGKRTKGRKKEEEKKRKWRELDPEKSMRLVLQCRSCLRRLVRAFVCLRGCARGDDARGASAFFALPRLLRVPSSFPGGGSFCERASERVRRCMREGGRV